MKGVHGFEDFPGLRGFPECRIFSPTMGTVLGKLGQVGHLGRIMGGRDFNSSYFITKNIKQLKQIEINMGSVRVFYIITCNFYVFENL